MFLSWVFFVCLFYYVCMGAQSLESCPILCSLMDCSPPGSSVHGTLQARILEWVAMPFPRGSSQPWDQTQVSCFASRFFTSDPPGKPCFTIINTIKTNFLCTCTFFFTIRYSPQNRAISSGPLHILFVLLILLDTGLKCTVQLVLTRAYNPPPNQKVECFHPVRKFPCVPS